MTSMKTFRLPLAALLTGAALTIALPSLAAGPERPTGKAPEPPGRMAESTRPTGKAPEPPREQVEQLRDVRERAYAHIKAEKERIAMDMKTSKKTLSDNIKKETKARGTLQKSITELADAATTYNAKKTHTPQDDATMQGYMDRFEAAKSAHDQAFGETARAEDAVQGMRGARAQFREEEAARRGKPVRSATAFVHQAGAYGEAPGEYGEYGDYGTAPPELKQAGLHAGGYAAVPSMESIYDQAPAPGRLAPGTFVRSNSSGYDFMPTGPVRQDSRGSRANSQMQF